MAIVGCLHNEHRITVIIGAERLFCADTSARTLTNSEA